MTSDTRFVKMPTDLSGITEGSCFKVLHAMCMQMDYTTCNLTISTAQLRGLTGFPESTVRHAVHKLVVLGVITRTERHDRYGVQLPNTYRVNFDSRVPVEQHLAESQQVLESQRSPLEYERSPLESQHPYTESLQSLSRKRLTHLEVRTVREDDWSGPVIGQDPDTHTPPTKPKKSNYNNTTPGLIDYFHAHVRSTSMNLGGTNDGALGALFKRLLGEQGLPPELIRMSMLVCNDELLGKPRDVVPWKYYRANIDRLLVHAEKVGTGTVATSPDPGMVSAATLARYEKLKELKGKQP